MRDVMRDDSAQGVVRWVGACPGRDPVLPWPLGLSSPCGVARRGLGGWRGCGRRLGSRGRRRWLAPCSGGLAPRTHSGCRSVGGRWLAARASWVGGGRGGWSLTSHSRGAHVGRHGFTSDTIGTPECADRSALCGHRRAGRSAAGSRGSDAARRGSGSRPWVPCSLACAASAWWACGSQGGSEAQDTQRGGHGTGAGVAFNRVIRAHDRRGAWDGHDAFFFGAWTFGQWWVSRFTPRS